MDKVFDYEDIQLIPAKCVVNSRSECDTSVTLGGRTFKLPVVPANMQTIIDEKIAFYLAENGYFYIMHRFEPEKTDIVYQRNEQLVVYMLLSVWVLNQKNTISFNK